MFISGLFFMQLTPKQILIYSGKICPYCGRETNLAQNDFGFIYTCPPCAAFVGTRKDKKGKDGQPLALGRLADHDLRQKRMEAHKWFDMIWVNGYMGRKEAYWYLSIQLGLPKDFVHIAWFDHPALDWVIYFSKKYLKKECGVLISFSTPKMPLQTMSSIK